MLLEEAGLDPETIELELVADKKCMHKQGVDQMITAERKPFEQIKAVTDQFENILVVGCNTCVAVCLTGGEKEAEQLASQLRLQRKNDGIDGSVETVTVLRQCENEYVDAIAAQVEGKDLILSTACSIGPQLLRRPLSRKCGWLRP